MVDVFIKLMEKLLELLKLSKSIKKEKFEKIIKPLFEDLKTIHNDYLSIMNNVIFILKDNNDIEMAKSVFEKDRLEKRALREGTRGIVSALFANTSLERFNNFFSALNSYLYKGDLEIPRFENSTESVQILRSFLRADKYIKEKEKLNLLDKDEKEKISRDLQTLVFSEIKHLEILWRNVSEEYGKVVGETFN